MRPRLALAMIARDAVADLAACLASARAAVDEIVIADTGSRDATVALARAAGANVIEIPWAEDFAAARNAALAPVTADWILMLDADERLDSAAAAALPALMNQEGRDAHEATIRNYLPSLGIHLYDQPARANDSELPEARRFPAYAEHHNVRLFRRAPHIRFAGRVHENVARSILAAGGKIGPAGFLIHHFGLARGAEEQERKKKFYRELGRRKLADMPEDAQANLELGAAELEQYGDAASALPLFETACRLRPELALAWFYLGLARLRLGRAGEAITALERAEQLGAGGARVYEALGDALYDQGRFGDAQRRFRRALKTAAGQSCGDAVRSNLESKLGLAQARGGDEEGWSRLRRAARDHGGNSEAPDRLIAALAWRKDFSAAAEAAEEFLREFPQATETAYLRAAALRARLTQWPEAAKILSLGLVRLPLAAPLRAAAREVEAQIKARSAAGKNSQPSTGEMLSAHVPNSSPLG